MARDSDDRWLQETSDKSSGRLEEKEVLLIYGALARPSGRAPTCMLEPSLTVGLVPRIASRVVATRSYAQRSAALEVPLHPR
jgi:hypothetical protein